MAEFDLVIRNGTIFDGDGGPPREGAVAVRGERIVAVGEAGTGGGAVEVDATGLAVAPGFINMMSWAVESLIEDGRSMSDLRQGITLEVFGEGWSMGPLNDDMRARLAEEGLSNMPDRFRYPVPWTTLFEYLAWLEARGVSANIASFVGAGTLRIHEVGFEDRPATPEELARMCDLLRAEMAHGALGLASSLIYPPETYSSTAELIALSRVAAAFDGLYASHMRSEGDTFLEALQELLDIAGGAGIRAEVYHLKAAGHSNWEKMDRAIEMIEGARAGGLAVTADMYPYAFSGTDLSACIPPWAHEGGRDTLVSRLLDPDARARIKEAMATAATGWENAYAATGPERVMITGSLAPDIGPLQGRTLAEAAAARGSDPRDTLMDLLVENGGSVHAMYFDMSEDNLRRQVALPWVSFCTDAESVAADGRLERPATHPRAYGAFPRVLGRYVREQALIPLEEAIRRMTSLPATNLRLEGRGRLATGCHADIVAFDPDAIQDHATATDPDRYASGMAHVVVNGTPVLLDGEHTGATPGRFVRGPGVGARAARSGASK